MAVWSSFSRSFSKINQFKTLLNGQCAAKIAQNAIQARQMADHGKQMFITPSRFQWHKFKDMFHYYIMIGAIPIAAIVFYANVFIGPATLTEIPEDYVPKHWEYHRHPISRFIARYLHPSPQQEYEKMCHVLFEEKEKSQIRALEDKIRVKMAERNDYQAYHYKQVMAKYHRISKESATELENLYGDK